MRRVLAVTALSLILSTAPVAPGGEAGPRAHAAAVSTAAAPAAACTDVEAIWARGSGQGLGDGQYDRWFEQLNARIKGSVTLGHYEVGTTKVGDYQYPAVDVDDVWNGNPGGAWMGSGYAFQYGDSVWQGVGEYSLYLAERAALCPDTVFVAGGFSQGAQVIGQAYTQVLPDHLRDRIAFNALFGDPKLYLPEGEGVWPAACRGEARSPWRRRIANCDVDNGSLSARKPYLPSGFETTTGLWCAADDFVCGSSKNPTNTKGHVYNQAGGDIDSAAIEIAERLDPLFPDAPADDIDPTVFVIATGTTGLDVAFILDSTGSMSSTIDGAKQFAADMASTIRGLRGRVALIEYRDAGDTFVAATRSGLDNDITGFQSALDDVTAAGGGDAPEAGLAALMQAFNSLDWRPGATKAAIVLTDAPFHNPDVATGVNVDQVVARSLEIDPVNVYPVVPDYEQADYEDLAQRTSGRVIVNDGNAEEALLATFDELENRPVVLLGAPEYYAQPGQVIRFDASDSYAPSGTVAGYDWDFDGDGTYEERTSDPVTTHVYASPGKVNMAVQVTDDAGRLGSMSAPVTVSENAPVRDAGVVAAPSPLGATPGPVVTGKRDIDVTWTPAAGPAADRWAVYLDGVPLGLVEGTQHTVTVRGVTADVGHEVGVAGQNAEGDLGDQATAVVAAVPPPVVSPAPNPPVPVPTVPGPLPPTVKVRPVTVKRKPIVRLGGVSSDGFFDVEVRTARYNGTFGAWRDVSPSSLITGPKVKGPRLSKGFTQCYRSRVTTAAGESGWSTTVCTARPVDAAKLRGAQGWRQVDALRAYGRTLITASSGKVRLGGVRTSRLALSFQSCPTCGKVKVKAGGKKVGTVNTRGRSRKVKTVVLPYRKFTRGTVSVRVVGRARPVYLDAMTAIRVVE